MTMDKRLIDSEMRARALSRWEGEGGALAPSGTPDSIDESELRLLARLGAALLDERNACPTILQNAVAERAAALGTGDHARVRENLAQFLRDHRDRC